MGVMRLCKDYNTNGSASANTSMKQNTSFTATSEIHVFIGFNCAANLSMAPYYKESSNVWGGGAPSTKGAATLMAKPNITP